MPLGANLVNMDFLRSARGGPRLSGNEIRRLLELRELVKVESLLLPPALQHELLEILEHARPRDGARHPLPEMSRGELIRAIRWRLGTVPLPGATAAAEFVLRHRSQRRPRRRTAGSPTQPPSHRRGERR